MDKEFREGEYIIYQNGDTFQLGKIKRLCKDGAFVWYHEGDTAAKTPFSRMHKLENSFVLGNGTALGGADYGENEISSVSVTRVESGLYDTEEIHENCTVQIWMNSVTGEVSFGWWENREGEK